MGKTLQQIRQPLVPKTLKTDKSPFNQDRDLFDRVNLKHSQSGWEILIDGGGDVPSPDRWQPMVKCACPVVVNLVYAAIVATEGR